MVQNVLFFLYVFNLVCLFVCFLCLISFLLCLIVWMSVSWRNFGLVQVGFSCIWVTVIGGVWLSQSVLSKGDFSKVYFSKVYFKSVFLLDVFFKKNILHKLQLHSSYSYQQCLIVAECIFQNVWFQSVFSKCILFYSSSKVAVAFGLQLSAVSDCPARHPPLTPLTVTWSCTSSATRWLQCNWSCTQCSGENWYSAV